MGRRAAVLRATLAGLLLAGLVVLLPATPAAACSCAERPSIDEAAAQLDVVLSGEVTGNEEIDLFRRELRVAVDRVWKGEARVEQLVVTHAQGPACGIDPAVGTELAILATTATDGPVRDDLAEPGELVVGSCWGVATPDEVSAALGPGRPPDGDAAPASTSGPPAKSSDDGTGGTGTYWWGVGAIGLLGAIRFGLLPRLRRRAGRGGPA